MTTSPANGASRLKIGESSQQPNQIACMEIWGGNDIAETPVELPGLTGWVHSKPKEPATFGGDVYYLSVCSAGLLSRIVLADVSGHGQKASSTAAALRDLLRKHMNTWDQSELMRDINEAFEQRPGASVQYATAAVLSYYSGTRELIFANAGHPPMLWYRAAKKQWDLLNPETPHAERYVEGLPLGLISGTDYVQTAVRLERDDLILLYTDGLSEAMNENEEMLGSEGLLDVAQKLPAEDAVAVGKALLEKVRKFRGNRPSNDDLSLLVLKQTGN